MDKTSKDGAHSHRLGGWLPARHHHEAWVAQFAAAQSGKRAAAFHPAIERFQAMLDADPVARMYVTRMIDEVPSDEVHKAHHIKNVEHMLILMNAMLTFAPEFDDTALVATPLSAIVDWSMGTPSGLAAFRYPPVNEGLKNILTAWCEFLSGPGSRHVINASPNGWKSPAARAAMRMDDYDHSPGARYWGFNSWNDFFIRKFKPGKRPIAAARRRATSG